MTALNLIGILSVFLILAGVGWVWERFTTPGDPQ